VNAGVVIRSSYRDFVTSTAASGQRSFNLISMKHPKQIGTVAKPSSTSSSRTLSGSSKPESSAESAAVEGSPFVANIALATVLFGFVGFVFTYSMNAVGRSDGEDDPLAQLKAEAQEARDSTSNPALTQRKMTPEEIMALESGMGSKEDEHGRLFGSSGDVEVAVAAPADIAALEEEANLKVFRQRQQQQQQPGGATGSDGQQQKKKPWWRFGF
jgi:hypothetical protein